jgi:hypothetical protein
MHRFGFGLWVLVAGCASTIADDALSVCQPLCRCGDVPLPAEQRDCVASCVAQFERNPLGADCVTCVISHATTCARLDADCGELCSQAIPRAPGAGPRLGPETSSAP